MFTAWAGGRDFTKWLTVSLIKKNSDEKKETSSTYGDLA
jgi:hypothetical protein